MFMLLSFSMNMAAEFPVFIEKDNSMNIMGQLPQGVEQDDDGNYYTDLRGPQIMYGNAGEKPQVLTNERPSANFQSFVKLVQKAMSASVGGSYIAMMSFRFTDDFSNIFAAVTRVISGLPSLSLLYIPFSLPTSALSISQLTFWGFFGDLGVFADLGDLTGDFAASFPKTVASSSGRTSGSVLSFLRS